MKRLQQQIAIVTGASFRYWSGVVAIALAKAGAKVCINYRSSEDGAKKNAQ